VKNENEIVLKAPKWVTDKELKAFVTSKQGWIEKAIGKVQERHIIKEANRREFTEGSTHYYLGQPKKLRIKRALKPNYRLAGEYIILEIAHSTINEKIIEHYLYSFYKYEAYNYFFERIFHFLKLHPIFKKKFQKLSVKRMVSRWGSCSSSGNLSLNVELIRTEPGCIDTVILHELTHLVHMNHGPQFHELLGNLMPEYKYYENLLKKYPIRY
jgi:predicted metal-dependent hydrolase